MQESSVKLCGEEKCADAVYTVYLKKVCYQSHKTVSGEKTTHLEWETVRVKAIKAGTLEKLVENLIADTGELEPTYVNIFFSTYRSFATAQQVMTLLFGRYMQICDSKVEMDEKSKELCKVTLSRVLQVWLNVFPEDFYEPPQFFLLSQLLEFAMEYYPESALELRGRYKLEKLRKYSIEEQNCNSSLMQRTEKCISSPALLQLTFLEVPAKHFALQLTYLDSELFKKLVAHHCLGSLWSQREKAPTVTATVQQFNAVSFCVISTVLSDPSLKPILRAKIISKWIDIAQELRFLKNFSSLKAITSALQCNPVYRLKRIWFMLPNDKVETFAELARIFSEENNQINSRKLLIKEGSAKYADTIGADDKQLQKALNKQMAENGYTMQGTVPYLGTFLTDLTMIDTAVPDYLPNELINFDKRRKEFEILAQIKLLQSASNNYDISPDRNFQAWFSSVPVLDDSESYELSCLIEPLEMHWPEKKAKSSLTSWSHGKSNSLSNVSTSSYSGLMNGLQSFHHSQQNYDANNGKSAKFDSCATSNFLFGDPLSSEEKSFSQEYYIIKISIDKSPKDVKGTNLYKSIMLCNRDHTQTVIVNAMKKHGITGDPDEYVLAQLVPEGEIVFPNSANVFYAVNTSYDLNFVLRSRGENDADSTKRDKPRVLNSQV